MDQHPRSTFLRRAGVSILAGASFFYPGIDKAFAGQKAARAALNVPPGKTVVTLDGADPTFATGEVVAKTPTRVTLQSGLGAKEVQIAPDAVVWKEFDLDPSVIRIGDWVDAKVVAQPDGTLAAVSGWVYVNIGRHEGTFLATDGKTVTSTTATGTTHVLELSSQHDVIRASDLSAIGGGVRGLTPGDKIGAVGLRLPNEGLRATRIWIA